MLNSFFNFQKSPQYLAFLLQYHWIYIRYRTWFVLSAYTFQFICHDLNKEIYYCANCPSRMMNCQYLIENVYLLTCIKIFLMFVNTLLNMHPSIGNIGDLIDPFCQSVNVWDWKLVGYPHNCPFQAPDHCDIYFVKKSVSILFYLVIFNTCQSSLFF